MLERERRDSLESRGDRMHRAESEGEVRACDDPHLRVF